MDSKGVEKIEEVRSQRGSNKIREKKKSERLRESNRLNQAKHIQRGQNRLEERKQIKSFSGRSSKVKSEREKKQNRSDLQKEFQHKTQRVKWWIDYPAAVPIEDTSARVLFEATCDLEQERATPVNYSTQSSTSGCFWPRRCCLHSMRSMVACHRVC